MAGIITNVHELINFSADQKQKFMDLMKVLQEVVNSEEFKGKVLNYSYKYYTRSWFRKIWHEEKGFVDNNGHSPQRIFEKFMSGASILEPETDGEIDIYLTLYFSGGNVIGYTHEDTVKQWINGKFFTTWLKTKEGRASIIGNIVHEYMHKLGYDHSFHYNDLRPHSVPYAYGEIAENVALEFFREEL